MATNNNMQCNITPTKEDLAESAQGILKAAGAQACNNNSRATQASASLEFQAEAGFGLASMGGSANVSFADSASSSIGCDQIGVLSQQFASATKKIACFMNEDRTSKSTIVNNINRITFKSGGKLTIKGNVDINQNIEMKLVDLATLSTNVKQQISNEVYATAMQTADAIQTSKSGFGATPQGSKSISDLKTKITDENVTNIVNQTIRDLSITVNNKNEVIFESKDDLTLLKDFTVSQNLIVDITATAILTNSVDNVLKSFTQNASTQTAKMTQVAENLGAESLGKQAGDAAKAIIEARGKNSTYGIIGIIACIFVLGLFLKFAGVGKMLQKRGSIKPSKGAKIVLGFIIFLGIGLMVAGGLLIKKAFITYDEEYLKKMNEDLATFRKCVEDKKTTCSIESIDEYKEPIALKITSIVMTVFGFVFFVYGLKLVLFDLGSEMVEPQQELQKYFEQLPIAFPITQQRTQQQLPIAFPITQQRTQSQIPTAFPITQQTTQSQIPTAFPITQQTTQSQIPTAFPIVK
jgi:hypothetical protein